MVKVKTAVRGAHTRTQPQQQPQQLLLQHPQQQLLLQHRGFVLSVVFLVGVLAGMHVPSAGPPAECHCLPSPLLPALPLVQVPKGVPPATVPPYFNPKGYLSLLNAHEAGAQMDYGWGVGDRVGRWYDPSPVALRGGGWHRFTSVELLQCIAASGGWAFTGDSVMRETVNALLSLVGSTDTVDTRVAHEFQTYSGAFAVPGVENATARIAFRFARNLAPELGEKAKELLAGGVAKTLFAGSGFWDLNPGQGGGDHRTALPTYATRLARFLTELASALEGAPPRPALAAPFTLVWRTITPIAYAKAPEDRRDFISIGRTEAANAVAKKLIEEGWNADPARDPAVLPHFKVIDSTLIMPPGDEGRVAEDGYHPSAKSLELFVAAFASEVCPEARGGFGWPSLKGLSELAKEPIPPQL